MEHWIQIVRRQQGTEEVAFFTRTAFQYTRVLDMNLNDTVLKDCVFKQFNRNFDRPVVVE